MADATEMRLAVNEQTGKLRPVWVNGDVAFDDSMTETVMSLLVEGDGPLFRNRRVGPGPLSVAIDTADATSSIKARAEERLQLAVNDGRLQSYAVTVTRPPNGARGRFLVGVDYVTRTGQAQSLALPVG